MIYKRVFTGTIANIPSLSKIGATIDMTNTGIPGNIVDISPLIVQLRSTANRCYYNEASVGETSIFIITNGDEGKDFHITIWYAK